MEGGGGTLRGRWPIRNDPCALRQKRDAAASRRLQHGRTRPLRRFPPPPPHPHAGGDRRSGEPLVEVMPVQEAKAASALKHPSIITIYDIDEASGVDFIALECVRGKPLGQLVGRK